MYPFLGVDTRYSEPDSSTYIIKIKDRKSFIPLYFEMGISANVIKTMSGKIAIIMILYGGTITMLVRGITDNTITRESHIEVWVLLPINFQLANPNRSSGKNRKI